MYSAGLIVHEGKAYGPNGQRELGSGEVLGCGHPRPEVEKGAFTVPWAIVQTNEGQQEYCLECCAKLEIEALRVLPKGAGYTAYFKLSNPPKSWRDLGQTWCTFAPGNEITTWHGEKLMTIYKYTIYLHNFGGRFIAISAKDVHGNYWHGRASYDWGECINLYKSKNQSD